MTSADKDKKSARPRKSSSAGTTKKTGGGQRKPRIAGTTSNVAAKAAAAPKPAAKAAATAKRTWEPQIVVFACNWCSYAGADTAGVSRIQRGRGAGVRVSFR